MVNPLPRVRLVSGGHWQDTHLTFTDGTPIHRVQGATIALSGAQEEIQINLTFIRPNFDIIAAPDQADLRRQLADIQRWRAVADDTERDIRMLLGEGDPAARPPA